MMPICFVSFWQLDAGSQASIVSRIVCSALIGDNNNNNCLLATTTIVLRFSSSGSSSTPNASLKGTSLSTDTLKGPLECRKDKKEYIAQWVETAWDRRVHFIQKKHLSHERGSKRSEQTSKRVSAVEGGSKVSSPEQANGRASGPVLHASIPESFGPPCIVWKYCNFFYLKIKWRN